MNRLSRVRPAVPGSVLWRWALTKQVHLPSEGALFPPLRSGVSPSPLKVPFLPAPQSGWQLGAVYARPAVGQLCSLRRQENGQSVQMSSS